MQMPPRRARGGMPVPRYISERRGERGQPSYSPMNPLNFSSDSDPSERSTPTESVGENSTEYERSTRRPNESNQSRSGYQGWLSPEPSSEEDTADSMSVVRGGHGYRYIPSESETLVQPEQPQQQPNQNEPIGVGPLMTVMQNVLDELRRQIPANPPPVVPQTAEPPGQTSGRNRKVTRPEFLKYVMQMKDIGQQRFFGGGNLFAGHAWLMKLEKNFDAIWCEEQVKRDLAVYYLEDNAHIWWENVERAYGDTEITWEIFRQEFVRKFFSPETRDRLEIQFNELHQGDRSVRDFEAEFTRLRRFAHYGHEDEASVIRKFLMGLRPEIRGRLQVVEFHSLYTLVERAVNIEESIKAEIDAMSAMRGGPEFVRRFGPPTANNREQAQHARARGRQYMRGRGRGSVAGRGVAPVDSLPTCYNCGRKGHFSRACPNAMNRTANVPAHITCFHCGEKGHYATSCPLTHPAPQQMMPPPPTRPAIEPPAKRQSGPGRVYALDAPETSRPPKGPVTGMISNSLRV